MWILCPSYPTSQLRMPYQIQPLREFLVRPALPPALSRLLELGYNLLWSWDHTIRVAVSAGWIRRCGRIATTIRFSCWAASRRRSWTGPLPIRVSCSCTAAPASGTTAICTAGAPDRRHAADRLFLDGVRAARLHADLLGRPGHLSGDHLKAASDGDFALTGVGLLYQAATCSNTLNPDGWQQERTPAQRFLHAAGAARARCRGQRGHRQREAAHRRGLHQGLAHRRRPREALSAGHQHPAEQTRPSTARSPISSTAATFTSASARRSCWASAACARLKTLGIKPTVHHMNEGHSAFLAIERIRLLMQENGLELRAGLEATRVNNVFTTHTSVPAGIDLFDSGMVYEYFTRYCRAGGHSRSKSCLRWAGRICTTQPSASRWPCWRSRRRRSATP